VECHTPTAPRSWRDRSLASLPSSQRAARADRRAERGDGPSVDPSGGRVKSLSTDPELKGRWLIPRRQKGDFWACWDERDEAAFGGVCRWPLVVFGSTGLKKIHFFSWRVWAGFSVADIRPGFLNFFLSVGPTTSKSCCAAVTYVTRGAQIRSLFCRINTGTPPSGG